MVIAPKYKGFLIDLDGVLFVGDTPIPGAAETISILKSRDIPCRFVTNTTTKSIRTMMTHLRALQLPIEENDLITTPRAARHLLDNMGKPPCYFCVNDDVLRDFGDIPHTETAPRYIVIGDIDNRWDYDLMNRLFRMIIGGADIIALHKGRYWHERDGLRIDIGAFVSGLEYVTGKTAHVVGKPSPDFYNAALDSLGISASDVAMVGDDIDSDIGGAQIYGMKGILVKTGKYRTDMVAASQVRPDHVLDSIADLLKLINR
jgi:HAD superfamily hydrolase (TIGR01458 family)